jgi:hypothetical protein
MLWDHCIRSCTSTWNGQGHRFQQLLSQSRSTTFRGAHRGRKPPEVEFLPSIPSVRVPMRPKWTCAPKMSCSCSSSMYGHPCRLGRVKGGESKGGALSTSKFKADLSCVPPLQRRSGLQCSPAHQAERETKNTTET